MTKKNSDLAAELLTTAELASNVARLGLERTAAELAAGKHRDPAGAARNAAVVAGIAHDKRNQLLDRPDPVELDPREGIDILRNLGERIPGLIIETPPTLTQGPIAKNGGGPPF